MDRIMALPAEERLLLPTQGQNSRALRVEHDVTQALINNRLLEQTLALDRIDVQWHQMLGGGSSRNGKNRTLSTKTMGRGAAERKTGLSHPLQVSIYGAARRASSLGPGLPCLLARSP